MTRDEVLKTATDLSIRFIRLQFTDILGIIKNVAIPVEQLEDALDHGVLFDGSSIQGFVRIEESDMLLRPDAATFAVFPWRRGDAGATARLICDIYNPDGTPFVGCPRLTLKRAIAAAAEMGFTLNAGPEAEFFLFQRDATGKETTLTHDRGGYFDLSPLDRGEEARRDIVLALQEMGFEVESSHHEVGPGQHEIDFRYADALRTADNVATFRFVVRTIALGHNLHATFMPKPLYGQAGSGMHIHQSLFSGRENSFYDPNMPRELSQVCLHYIGGLMEHARGYTAITNPTVNSYKRLVSGYEAPVYLAWSEANRSPFIRIPAARGAGTRLELRSPDPSCNPYLALAVILWAGLDGIRREVEPPEPIVGNMYHMEESDLAARGIATLPQDLAAAVAGLEADEVIQEALGEHIVSKFIEAKRREWGEYRIQVHHWEIDKYLALL